MPEAERRQRPALLSAVARLENADGQHERAVESFREVAALTPNDKNAQAEAHYNAYRAALELRRRQQEERQPRRRPDGTDQGVQPRPQVPAVRRPQIPPAAHPGGGRLRRDLPVQTAGCGRSGSGQGLDPGKPGPGHGKGTGRGPSDGFPGRPGHHPHDRLRLRRPGRQDGAVSRHGLFRRPDVGRIRPAGEADGGGRSRFPVPAGGRGTEGGARQRGVAPGR